MGLYMHDIFILGGLSTPQAAESVLEPQTIEVGPVTYMVCFVYLLP